MKGSDKVFENEHEETAKVKQVIIRSTNEILDNFIKLPDQFPQTTVARTLAMTTGDYRKYMRTTTLNDITMNTVQEAYAIAL